VERKLRADGQEPDRRQAALTRENLQAAFKRVRANKGAAGEDGLDIDQTARHLVSAWPAIRHELLAGTYRPHRLRAIQLKQWKRGKTMFR